MSLFLCTWGRWRCGVLRCSVLGVRGSVLGVRCSVLRAYRLLGLPALTLTRLHPCLLTGLGHRVLRFWVLGAQGEIIDRGSPPLATDESCGWRRRGKGVEVFGSASTCSRYVIPNHAAVLSLAASALET